MRKESGEFSMPPKTYPHKMEGNWHTETITMTMHNSLYPQGKGLGKRE